MNLTLTQNKSFSSSAISPIVLFVGYILLLLFSTLFYKERVFYSDSAYYLFQIINTENFHFEHGRYGAFVSQLLPLIAVKFHFPLKVVAILYSISIPLFTCIWSIWIYYRKKEKALAFVALIFLMQILTVRHNWFWPVGELMQGLLFMCIGFFYLHEKKNSWIAPIIFLLALFCHPSVAPVLVVLLITRLSKENYIYTLCILALCGILFLLLPRSEYETQKMSAFLDVSKIIHSDFWIYLRNSTIKVYILLLPIIGYVLYKKRNLIFTIISVGFTIGWILLIAASEHQGTSAVLLENMMLPVTALWLVTVIEVKPSITWLQIYVLVAILSFGGYIFLLQQKTYGPNTQLQITNLVNWKSANPTSNTFRLSEKNRLVANDKIMKNRLPVEHLLQSTNYFNGNPLFVVMDKIDDEGDAFKLGPDLPTIRRTDLNKDYFNYELPRVVIVDETGNFIPHD